MLYVKFNLVHCFIQQPDRLPGLHTGELDGFGGQACAKKKIRLLQYSVITVENIVGNLACHISF